MSKVIDKKPDVVVRGRMGVYSTRHKTSLVKIWIPIGTTLPWSPDAQFKGVMVAGGKVRAYVQTASRGSKFSSYGDSPSSHSHMLPLTIKKKLALHEPRDVEVVISNDGLVASVVTESSLLNQLNITTVMFTEHVLKTLPQYWDAVSSGDKTFEVRRDDRGFQRGDVLVLKKDPGDGSLIRRRVTYILTGGQHGVEPGYVVLALEPMDKSA